MLLFLRQFLLFVTVALALSSCIHNLRYHPSANRTGDNNNIVYSALHDPDGDGDAKGFHYFPPSRPASGNNVFIFDPNHHAWAMYDKNGRRVNTGRASGGQWYCPDVNRGCRTITGKFRLSAKGGHDCISNKYPLETNGGAPMPYCMFFHPKGYAIHGSYDVPDRNASHGCIRITPRAAQWLSNNYMGVGTTIIVLPYH